jgi:hypothetical protein
MITQAFIDTINEQTKHPLGTVHDINFVSPDTDEFMFDTMFGPVSAGERFVLIQPNFIMAHIVAEAGCFQSVSEARKNGWNKPIPTGLTNFVVGKKKIKIWTFIEQKGS